MAVAASIRLRIRIRILIRIPVVVGFGLGRLGRPDRIGRPLEEPVDRRFRRGGRYALDAPGPSHGPETGPRILRFTCDRPMMRAAAGTGEARSSMDVRILGTLEVVDGARRVDLGLRKARMLFGALALQPGAPVPADRLAEAVWPGALPASWESTLYGHVSRLRRALEPDRAPRAPSQRIETRGGAYVLRLDTGELDAQRFERLGIEGRAALGRGQPELASPLLDAALAEWRGPVLADLADAPFVANEARRLDELRLVVVEERAEVELALGRHGAAVAELERLVADYPLRERCWELLLLALYRSGRQADALRRYQDVRAALVGELGIEPGPGLRELEAAILQHDGALRPDRVPATVRVSEPASVALPSWLAPAADTFVGRSAELDVLRREWKRCAGGERRLLVVAGEPGIGKTRLVREAGPELSGDGALVLGGRCAEDPVHVLEAFAEALGRLARADPTRFVGSDAAVLAGLVPELAIVADRAPPVDPDAQRYLLFRAVASALDSHALGAPVVLVLDDVQWAPPPTLQLLSHLLRDDERGALLVVATLRDTEPSVELAALIADLRRERRLERVRLEGLDAADVGQLARARGSDTAIEVIIEMTEGNPFYVEELVLHVAESDGALTPESVPESVRDTIARRLLRLPDAVRRLLGVAAVAGLQFDLDVVAEAGDVLVGDADDALAVAARIGVVGEHSRRVGSYTFSHALIRTVLRDGLGAARQARIHRRLGEVIVDRHPDRLAEIAHHLLAAAADGSDPVPGVRCAREASRQATARYAYDDAVAVLELARDRLPTAADPALHCELLVDLIDAVYRTGYRYGELPDLIRDAYAIAIDLDDPSLIAHVLIESFSATFAPLDEWAAHVEEMIDRLDEAAPARIMLTAMLARHWSSRPGERGRRLGEWALARCDALDPGDRQLAIEYLQEAVVPWSPPERMLELAVASHGAALASGDARRLVSALNLSRQALLSAGDLAGSDEVGREYEAIVESLEQPRHLAGAQQRRAMRALLAGRFAEAEVHAEETLAIQPTDEFLEGVAVQLFAIRFEQGRLDEMRPMVEAWAEQYDRAAWSIGYGVLLAEIGDIDGARAALRPHVTAHFADVPRDELWFLSLAAAATVADLLRDTEVAEILYELLSPHASRVIVAGQGALCWGSVHRRLAPLAVLLGATEPASMHFESAMSIHERLGAQPFLARDRLGYARLLRDTDGDEMRVRALARTGLAIARELGMRALVDDNLDLA